MIDGRMPSSHYKAPPIIEALIQFQFSDHLSSASRRKMAKRLSREYKNALETENVSAHIDFVKRTTAFESQPQTKLSSADEADILLIQSNVLSWSRLAPYEGWEALVSRVQRDLEIAHLIVGFRKLARLGVRFINRLDVPPEDGIFKFEDYLNINISLPDQWDMVQNYGWRFERLVGNLHTIVQSAVIAPEIPGYGAFLLDIDVVAQIDLPIKTEDIHLKLEEMRALKNNIFETSVSDKARASFSL